MDLRILEELGLSNAESKIYVALLENGQCKTGRIIDTTKLQSSTVYHILGSLVEKGIVSYIHIGKIKYYQAESPDVLLTFLEEKKKKLQTILPKLKEKEELSKQKQFAKVYEGLKGMTAAFNDILHTMKKGEEYYFFQLPIKQMKKKEIRLFLRNYHLKRSEKGIKVKGIALEETKNILEKTYDLPHTEIRYTKETTPTVIIIYKEKVLIFDWEKNPTAILIQSPTIFKSYKEFFLDKWKKAKK